MTNPRITPLTPDQAAPEVRPIFETYLRERGNIPNMFRTVALRPEHLRSLIAHFRTVMNEGTVPSFMTVRKCAIMVRRCAGRSPTVRNMFGMLPRSRR